MVKKTSKKKHTKYEEELNLLKIKKDIENSRHDHAMSELKYRRESDELHHQKELERGKIKSAEIRKHQERKAFMRN